MTEIAIHQPTTAVAVPDQQPNTGTDLVEWARQAEAAAIYAERVCSTQMVPAAYRGKPAEAAAAILAGVELGFSPIRSLNAFDNIQGTPAPKAITLRALVQAAGHEVRIVESTDERAVVAGRRRGDTEWSTSTWDMARAQKLSQFKTNPNYKTNPGQMLVARATAEVCRWIGSDAIMGVPYAAEELDHYEPGMPVANARGARRLTIDQLDGPAEIEQGSADGPMTDSQRGHMFALWEDLGFTTDEAGREHRLEVTSNMLGQKVRSWSELTSGQADLLITAFKERKDATAAGQ